MIKSPKAFFNNGSLLELGRSKGGFCPIQGYRGYKMLRSSHNEGVIPADSEHGQRCIYSLDTLGRDAVAAGLKVIYRPGTFLFCISEGVNEDLICCHRAVVRTEKTLLEVGACP